MSGDRAVVRANRLNFLMTRCESGLRPHLDQLDADLIIDERPEDAIAGADSAIEKAPANNIHPNKNQKRATGKVLVGELFEHACALGAARAQRALNPLRGSAIENPADLDCFHPGIVVMAIEPAIESFEVIMLQRIFQIAGSAFHYDMFVNDTFLVAALAVTKQPQLPVWVHSGMANPMTHEIILTRDVVAVAA